MVLLGLASAGCSMTASIDPTSVIDPVSIIQEKPGGAEFVSGSTGTYQTTATLHYKVQASVGHYIGQPVLETPTRHYKVYSSVQGSMLSPQ